MEETFKVPKCSTNQSVFNQQSRKKQNLALLLLQTKQKTLEQTKSILRCRQVKRKADCVALII